MNLPSLPRFWPQRHEIPMTWSGELSFRLRARAKWWPPFVATEFLAARYQIEISNPGDELGDLLLRVAVTPYAGPLDAQPQVPARQWREAHTYRRPEGLKTNETCKVYVTIPTGLLDEGTHAVRLTLLAGSEALHQSPQMSHAWVREYLRVEPLSSVLTLMIATGTFLTALATIALVLLN